MINLRMIFLKSPKDEGDWRECTPAEYVVAYEDPEMETKIELREPVNEC